jgi:hypothetical protein
MRAPGYCASHLAPRLGVRIGPWGASAQSARASGPDEPVILGECAPRVGAAAAAAGALLAAGHADRERGRLALQASSKLTEFKHRQARAPRCSCGCGSAAGGSALTAAVVFNSAVVFSRPRRRRGRPRSEAQPGGQRAGTGLLQACGAGAMDVALPLLYAARLSLNATVVARMLLGRWQVGAEADGCGC